MTDVQQTLDARGEQYGSYDLMADTAQKLKYTMRDTPGWESAPPQVRESLDMIATKIARILTGNPEHGDSWHDIQGYAKLVWDRIPAVPTSATA